jgi:PAS domain S-box-containing protein
MQDKRRTKEDLIREIGELRRRVSTLERAGTKGGKNEDALRESEATLKGILRAAPIGIGIVTNRILGWTNDYITNLLGYSHDELMGQNARILYESDEEFQRIALVKHPQVEQYGVGSVETRFRRKDGKFIDILLSSAAIVPGDMTQGLIYTVLDITERKQAEKVIAESEERYRRITDAVTDYIYTVRVADGRPMSTTHGPACVAVTGFSSEDFARDPYLWINMVHPEDRDAVRKQAWWLSELDDMGMDLRPSACA